MASAMEMLSGEKTMFPDPERSVWYRSTANASLPAVRVARSPLATCGAVMRSWFDRAISSILPVEPVEEPPLHPTKKPAAARASPLEMRKDNPLVHVHAGATAIRLPGA